LKTTTKFLLWLYPKDEKIIRARIKNTFLIIKYVKLKLNLLSFIEKIQTLLGKSKYKIEQRSALISFISDK
jgi:hypothetical protein